MTLIINHNVYCNHVKPLNVSTIVQIQFLSYVYFKPRRHVNFTKVKSAHEKSHGLMNVVWSSVDFNGVNKIMLGFHGMFKA